MKKELPPLNWTFDQKLRGLLALINIALTVLAVWVSPVINDDGALYLAQAKAFSEGGFEAAWKVYNWPFYSFLIYIVHAVTWFGWEWSAYVVNMLCYALLFDCLYRLFRLVAPDTSLGIWFAILLLCFTPLNDYRDMIVRDAGYWAFLVAAIYYFCRYIAQPNAKRLLGWHGCALIAVLFRVEGVLVYIFLPFLALLLPEYRRRVIGNVISLKLLPLLLLVASVVAVMVFDYQARDFKKFSQLFNSATGFINGVAGHVEGLTEHVLPKFSRDLAPFIYLGAMAFYLVAVIVQGVSYAWSLLFVWMFCRGKANSVVEGRLMVTRIVLCAAIISMLTLYCFALYRSFTTVRYMMPVILLLFFVASFGLVRLALNAGNGKWWARAGLYLLLFYGFADPYVSSNISKEAWPEVGDQISNVINSEMTLSNDQLLSHYAESKGVVWSSSYFTQDADWFKWFSGWLVKKGFKYLMLKEGGGVTEEALMAKVPFKLVETFELNKREKVLLFKVEAK
ncbi:hypothetical protein QP938_05595 [Porticoccaceae bacterium LTM1]|nr:hypothetical protein QP938_05595 [Porticoccaceae bacterium LTM1]